MDKISVLVIIDDLCFYQLSYGLHFAVNTLVVNQSGNKVYVPFLPVHVVWGLPSVNL